jgi:7-keto-8-aminopelargonate synthetase-like enzyme
VKDAAKAAIDRFGTSVSASRLSAGERELHRELEAELARFLGAQDALVFVGGHATNVSVIGHLFSPQDLILYDAAMHNSALWGARLSGARCLAFPHGDLFALERLLERERASHRLALVLVESVYSTDGDVPDLPALVELKRKHVAWLMVDEAHAIGVLGARGRGIAEHFAVPASEIDLLMGTLSKALASCGGYVAGSRELVRYLRYTCPGFVFAAGISPANSAAALQALRVLQAEPQRVTALRARAEQFVCEARARGLDTGPSRHAAVVPVNVGETRRAIRLSNELFQAGINVQPLVAPAVAPDAARLRFFLSAEHTQAQIRAALDRTVALAAAGVAASAG